MLYSKPTGKQARKQSRCYYLNYMVYRNMIHCFIYILCCHSYQEFGPMLTLTYG